MGKVLVCAALLGCLSPALSVVSLLSGRSPFLMPLDKKDMADRAKRTLARGETSDHVALLNAYEGWCSEMSRGGRAAASSFAWRNFLSQPTLQVRSDPHFVCNGLEVWIGYAHLGNS